MMPAVVRTSLSSREAVRRAAGMCSGGWRPLSEGRWPEQRHLQRAAQVLALLAASGIYRILLKEKLKTVKLRTFIAYRRADLRLSREVAMSVSPET